MPTACLRRGAGIAAAGVADQTAMMDTALVIR